MNGRKRVLDWKIFVFMFVILSVAAVPVSFAGEHGKHERKEHKKSSKKHGGAHWGYEGKHGPEHWGELSEKFRACSEGKTQSPIDIRDVKGASKAKVVLHYKPTKIKILNNGHTLKVSYDKGSYMTVNGKRYDLLQFHFHSPSEHTVGGKHSAMEMHLVHKSKDGGFAVIGVLIEKDGKNKAFSTLWKKLPEEEGEEYNRKATVNVADLLPSDKAFYNYTGSFTTPPCTEGVNWFVLKNKVHLSGHQVKEFREIMHGDNRPVQPINGRVITTGSI